MSSTSLAILQQQLQTIDDGVLKHGPHEPGRAMCVLEFDAALRGRSWSDAPVTLPDLRPLNDGPWISDVARTEALLPVMVALWDWTTWSPARQQQWVIRVAVETVRQLVSALPGLPDAVRIQCRNAMDLKTAAAAAQAASEAAQAAEEAAAAAAWAARAAEATTAWAAWTAAEAVTRAATGAARAATGAATATATEAVTRAAAWAAGATSEAARAAAATAQAAAWAVRTQVGTIILCTACQIWIEACKEEPNTLESV